MAPKLPTLLAAFAACGIVHAEKNPFESSTGGSGSSGGGSESTGRSSASSGGGLILPPTLAYPFSVGGSSGGQSSGSEWVPSSGDSALLEALDQTVYNLFGGRGTGSSPSGYRPVQHLVSYCQQLCKYAGRTSRVSRIPSSRRQEASHGLEQRHGRRSSLPQPIAGQHSRQGQLSCPPFCNGMLSNLPVSGSSSQSSSTGESGTSASGSDGSSTTSGGSSGSSGASIGGSSSGK